ncbi:MAG: cyclic nucleotide-binding domain-containing protein [Polyangiaceae bacterium]
MTIGAASAQSLSPYEVELARRVEAEALACIGCNDCLLACPIPEAQSVTIGELNRALHLPLITAENVARFVSSCTQCGQCVPACPADLSRAQMVLYNKLKVEDSVQDFQLLLTARTVAFPAGITRNALAGELEGLELFRGASSQALRRLVQKSTLRLLVPGEVLCEEGEFHERLCIVLSGALDQVSRAGQRQAVHLVTLGPGSFFGEMGILGDAPEPFEVVAKEKTIVLESPKVAVLRLLAEAPAVEHTLEALYARRALWTYAKSPGALGALPDPAIDELFHAARLELLSSGQTLLEAGSPPRDFFLVRSGFLRAVQRDARGERVLTYFREGNVFGILPLLNREAVQRYSVFAVSRAEVICVPATALGGVLARYPGSDALLAQAAFEAERLARASDVGLGPLPTGELASIAPGSRSGASGPSLPGERAPLEAAVLVERGIAKGREVLVIDQTRCTGCGNCIDACQRRHGKSRLQLRGIQVENYLFPSACRHCEDPACLLCSVNGIARLPSGEIQIIAENCIGCGSCAERCPYGSISMHAAENEARGFMPRLRDFLAGPTLRRQALEAIEPNRARVAVKCDLCAHHSDYACVTACPTAAAFRVNPQAALRGEPST